LLDSLLQEKSTNQLSVNLTCPASKIQYNIKTLLCCQQKYFLLKNIYLKYNCIQ